MIIYILMSKQYSQDQYNSVSEADVDAAINHA